MKTEAPRLVQLEVFSSDAEAHIVAGALEAEGIECVLENEMFSRIYPIGFNSLGGIPLYVRQEDYDRAVALLKQLGDN